MAAAAAQSAPKGTKAKAAKIIDRAESPAPSVGSGAAADSQDDSPYIKELQKNIRNLNKKITNASKTDSLLSQHPGKTLDELVASKVINTDQKTQIQKKPALQAQLAQAEEQLAQYQKIHEQYRTKAATDKAEWEKSLEKVKTDAVKEAQVGFKKTLNDNLLVLSQFLRLAAYRREEGSNPESDETQAIEGVLLAIYAGDETAVSSMLKLVDGTSDKVLSVPGEELQTTYSAVKTLAQEYKAPVYNDGTQPAEEDAAKDAPDTPVATSVATELEVAEGSAPNGQEAPASASDVDNGMSVSQEWVDVKLPRDPSETEAGLTAAPAVGANTQSWADDQPEPAKQAAPAVPDANDGFHQVQRNRGRQDREGGNGRGRGRGEHRGRGGGGRGDGRGRGRGRGGGGGGGGVPSRGPRRNDDA